MRLLVVFSTICEKRPKRVARNDWATPASRILWRSPAGPAILRDIRERRRQFQVNERSDTSFATDFKSATDLHRSLSHPLNPEMTIAARVPQLTRIEARPVIMNR